MKTVVLEYFLLFHKIKDFPGSMSSTPKFNGLIVSFPPFFEKLSCLVNEVGFKIDNLFLKLKMYIVHQRDENYFKMALVTRTIFKIFNIPNFVKILNNQTVNLFLLFISKQ